MSLSDYLAKNYLSSNKDQKKSERKDGAKKRKATSDHHKPNVFIQDDSPSTLKRTKTDHPDEDSISSREIVSPSSQALSNPKLKPKPSGWKIVGTDDGVVQRKEEEEEQPMMESGAKAGLQTAKEVSEQIRQKREKELKYLRENTPDSMGKSAETIHRDKSGRRIDIDSKIHQDRQRREHEKKEAERKIKEMNMGLIQKLDLEEQRQFAHENKNEGITRYADDERLNAQLKQRQHEDDPLQGFKTPSTSNRYVSRTGRKLYTKGFPENRFNIAPGYRWDGVDRSNGFEKKWFKKQAETTTNEKLSYTMQEDY